jgi:hypothetical protein
VTLISSKRLQRAYDLGREHGRQDDPRSPVKWRDAPADWAYRAGHEDGLREFRRFAQRMAAEMDR